MFDLNSIAPKTGTNKSMSVCLVSDDFLPSATGVGSHLQVVSAELAKRGHQVSVITSRRPGQPKTEVWQGVRVYRTRTLKLFGFYQALPSVADVKKILTEVRPDIMHFHYLSFLLLRVKKIAKRLKIPSVYTYHMDEVVLTQPLPMRPFRPLIAKKIIGVCNDMDQIISVSKNLAAQLPEKGIKTPIKYISNPLIFSDKNTVVPMPRENNFAVLFAGRLDPEKNIPYLLQAFKKLLITQPNAELWVAGRGSQLNSLEKLASELGIKEHIKFLGFLSHEVLSKYYASCDVFVLPSISETQGLVAMEAMWFSKPIIVTNQIVSAKELVDHGQNGYIVDVTSVDDLTNRLATLANDPALRLRMGEAGRKQADEYRPELVMDALENIYQQVELKHAKIKEHQENHNTEVHATHAMI